MNRSGLDVIGIRSLGATTKVKKAELIADLRGLAKDWLKYSGSLREIESFKSGTIDAFDQVMQGVFESTTTRTRASTYRNKLKPMLSGFLDSIIVPVIKHEGSPAQVAARQLMAEFPVK
jgi:hypothetical protein